MEKSQVPYSSLAEHMAKYKRIEKEVSKFQAGEGPGERARQKQPEVCTVHQYENKKQDHSPTTDHKGQASAPHPLLVDQVCNTQNSSRLIVQRQKRPMLDKFLP